MPPRLISRLDPPPLELDPFGRWILGRAFGPADARFGMPGPGVGPALGRSGLAPRVASRVPAATLNDELGPGTWTRARHQASVHALAYEPIVEVLSGLATEGGFSIVLLKGYALVAGGHAAPGSREVGDLDVLTDRAVARHLVERLTARGYEPAPGSRNEQHLPPLQAPDWGVIDVHDAVRGVGTETAWLDAAGALALGEPSEVQPGCWVPDSLVLTAHALTHSLEQHASSPNAYPLLRGLGDLIDLQRDREAWKSTLPRLLPLVHRTMGEEDILAARDLCLALQRGEAPDARAPAGRLLAHFLAHTFDSDYRRSLRSRHRRHRLAQALRRRTLVGYARRKFRDLWTRTTRKTP